jgi:hypothetical protein
MPFVLENRNRHVFGSVNTECGVCFPFTHSPAWGNWGVNSPNATRTDDTQFMGWRSGNPVSPCGENISSSKPQWNSCTGTYTSSYYYNYNNNTEQWSPDVKNYAAWSITWSSCPYDYNDDGVVDEGGCGNGTGWREFSESGEYMTLYELDDHWGDEAVTTLYYNSSMVIDVWCDGWSCGSGESSWQGSSSNSIASADARLRTVGAVWDDPNNCCSNGVNYCQ